MIMRNNKVIPSYGFTLLELLTVIVVMAITLGIGLPSFNAILASSRLTASANDLVAALQLARSESIKQVKFAGVSITGNTWNTFIETSSNVIQKFEAAPKVTIQITSLGNFDETPTYSSDGRLQSTTPITVKFTTSGSSEQRILTASPIGRISVSK